MPFRVSNGYIILLWKRERRLTALAAPKSLKGKLRTVLQKCVCLGRNFTPINLKSSRTKKTLRFPLSQGMVLLGILEAACETGEDVFSDSFLICSKSFQSKCKKPETFLLIEFARLRQLISSSRIRLLQVLLPHRDFLSWSLCMHPQPRERRILCLRRRSRLRERIGQSGTPLQ
jgi:hypothetical protein